MNENNREDVQRDMTNKFLNGELSFTAYSEQWVDEAFKDEDYELEMEESKIDVVDEFDQKIDFISEAGPSSLDKSPAQKSIRKSKKVRRTLPPALKGLMGEANLRYVRGEKDMAEKICLEIIRQVPTASEPFQTLAQIYEGDREKSLQFSLIAAHLNPSDADMWMRLAALTRESGDVNKQIMCYTRAIAAQPYNISYHFDRLKAVEQLENTGAKVSSINLTSLQCYLRLLRCLPKSEGANILSIAKRVAKNYHDDNKPDKALMAMSIAYEKVPDLFTFEEVNLYLELLLARQKYEKCLNVFVSRCNIEIEADIQTVLCGEKVEELTDIVSCRILSDLPVDLRSKLIVCLIHMKAFHLIETLLDNLIKHEDVEVIGDLYLDIEEALTREGRHAEALQLLEPLVKSQKFSLPAVWLKYAECLIALNRETDAIEPLKTVVELAPQHFKARLALSEILKKENRFEEALLALEQNENMGLIDTGLLYDRCLLLRDRNDHDLFLKVGFLMLSRHFYKIRNKNEIQAFRMKDTYDSLRSMREAREEDVDDKDNTVVFDETSNRPTPEQEWEIMMEMFRICQQYKYNEMFQRLSYSALGSKKFSPHRSKLEFISLLSCLQNNDYGNAYGAVRDLILKYPDKIRVWNALNLVIQRMEDARHIRFTMRSIKKFNKDESYNILTANYYLICGSYKSALKYYLACYKNKNSSLLALLCGVTMIHIACQKFTSNKNVLVIQGLAFMDIYEKLRGAGGKQEIYYNLGRMYHQLGLLSYAEQHYKKALEEKVEIIDGDDSLLNLQWEIAYNLHLIHAKNSPLLAQYYLEKYLVV